MDPDDSDRHVPEPSSLSDANAEAQLASGFSQQVEDNNNSNYLDSLDLSLLGSPEFDFSCLMDIDEAAEATQEPEQPDTDSMMLDAPAFEAPGVIDDLTITQILMSNAFHGSHLPGTNFYPVHDAPQHQGHVPQFQVGLDPMTSEAFNTFESPSGNTSTDQDLRLCELTVQCLVESFAYPVEMTRIMPEAPQPSGFGDQRFMQMNEPPTQVQVPLPRPSRPRRRGPLTREQAEGQALARENGVCIRCRRNNITPSMNETLFTEGLDEELATKALAFTRHMLENPEVTPIINSPWSVAFQGLGAICFPDGRYQRPRSSMVRKAEAQLLKNYPADTAGFPCVLTGNDRLKWTRKVVTFCDDRCLDNPYEDDLVINTGTSSISSSSSTRGVFVTTPWLLSRYVELQLFRYLQNAANNPSKDIYEQRDFAYSALYLLGHSFFTSSTKTSGLETSDEMFKKSIKDHLDRERRVRLALWVYVSITVGQLPSEANFWGNLPNELKAFRGGLPKKFRESFDGFNNSLHMNMKIEQGSKARFLQLLHSGQQTQEPKEGPAPPSDIDHDRFLWQSNTADQHARKASHAFLDIATVTDTGTDVEFLRLKRLLQKNGSWLRQVCGQLNGLVQAMKQIGHALHDEKRLRAFQVILRRKVQEVFGSQEASCRPQSLHCQDPRGMFFLTIFEKYVRRLFGNSDGWRGMLYENFQSIFLNALEEMHDGDLALQDCSIMERVVCTLVKVNLQCRSSGVALAVGCSWLLSEDDGSRLETVDAMGMEFMDAIGSFYNWMEGYIANYMMIQGGH
ncbi:hypothetical protein FPCIR_979 [Fusarium pseudocircinatum]|uniref:Uncharacterized protein n=1 Tax=Fusarium pseudocircinatum TaxID=56676 RepID=A0A8H5UYN7_9HYPO|nr:hypothetical protein FPCIR_979 [Fusarium pseudocircinatum]